MLAVIATFIQSTLLLPNLPSREHAHQTTSLKLCHEPIALPSTLTTKGLFVTQPKHLQALLRQAGGANKAYSGGQIAAATTKPFNLVF